MIQCSDFGVAFWLILVGKGLGTALYETYLQVIKIDGLPID